jgi:hypothetical protein
MAAQFESVHQQLSILHTKNVHKKEIRFIIRLNDTHVSAPSHEIGLLLGATRDTSSLGWVDLISCALIN